MALVTDTSFSLFYDDTESDLLKYISNQSWPDEKLKADIIDKARKNDKDLLRIYNVDEVRARPEVFVNVVVRWIKTQQK